MNGHVDLKDPFDVADVEWRIGATGGEPLKGLMLYYIDARAVMNRLDAYCAETGGTWQTAYALHGDGKHVECRLSVDLPLTRGGGESTLVAVTRADVGEPSQGMGDALKGAYSSALKRAAAQFGIGRYLYEIDDVWLPVEQIGSTEKYRFSKQSEQQAREHYTAFVANIGKPVTKREPRPDAEVAQVAHGARQAAKSNGASKGPDFAAFWRSVGDLKLTPDYVRQYVAPKEMRAFTAPELEQLLNDLVKHTHAATQGSAEAKAGTAA